MKINITGHETVLTPEIKKYTETKLNKLCRRYKQIIDASVVLEENHNKKERTAATAKVLLKIKGLDVSASAQEKTIFAAIDEAERKLIRQLDKEKAKQEIKIGKFAKSKDLIRKLLSKQEKSEK